MHKDLIYLLTLVCVVLHS